MEPMTDREFHLLPSKWARKLAVLWEQRKVKTLEVVLWYHLRKAVNKKERKSGLS